MLVINQNIYRHIVSTTSKTLAMPNSICNTRKQQELMQLNAQLKFKFDFFISHFSLHVHRLNLRTKECKKLRLTEPFESLGVPDDARFDEVWVLGLLGIAVVTIVCTI